MPAQPDAEVFAGFSFGAAPRDRLGHDAAHRLGQQRLVPPGCAAFMLAHRERGLDHPIVEVGQLKPQPDGSEHPSQLPVGRSHHPQDAQGEVLAAVGC